MSGRSHDELLNVFKQEWWAVAVRISRFVNAQAARADLGLRDLICLEILKRAGPLSASELAERAGLSVGGGSTAAIDRLEKKGYVKRVHSEDDRRKVEIKLIDDRLKSLVASGLAPPTEEWEAILDRYDASQLEVLLHFLGDLRDLPELTGEEAGPRRRERGRRTS